MVNIKVNVTHRKKLKVGRKDLEIKEIKNQEGERLTDERTLLYIPYLGSEMVRGTGHRKPLRNKLLKNMTMTQIGIHLQTSNYFVFTL